MEERDSLSSLIEAVTYDLEIARQQFDTDQAASGRWGVMTALDVLNRLGTVLLGDRAADLLTPIRNLQHALHDAEDGKSHPLLVPKKLSVRPPDRTEHLGLAGVAAVLMQLQMDAGEAKPNAARQVARRLDKLGYQTPQGKTITSNRVTEWRDRAMRERPVADIVAGRYDRMLSSAKTNFSRESQRGI